jgi:hypothetical protein
MGSYTFDGILKTKRHRKQLLIFHTGVKCPGYDVDLSPLSSAEVVKKWSCTSTPHVCVHSVDMDNFTFISVLSIMILCLISSTFWSAHLFFDLRS